MVSILLLYLKFPPLRSTIQWFPIYSCMQNSPPPCATPNDGLHFAPLFKLPPPLRAPPNNALHEASVFKLPPPALHHTMVSNLLFY